MQHLLAAAQAARAHHTEAETLLREARNDFGPMPSNTEALAGAVAEQQHTIDALIRALEATAHAINTVPGPMVGESLAELESATAAMRAIFVTREDAPEDDEEYMIVAAAAGVQFLDAVAHGIIGAMLGIQGEIAAVARRRVVTDQ